MVCFEYSKTAIRHSFGLGESSLDNRRREEFPAISNNEKLSRRIHYDK